MKNRHRKITNKQNFMYLWKKILCFSFFDFKISSETLVDEAKVSTIPSSKYFCNFHLFWEFLMSSVSIVCRSHISALSTGLFSVLFSWSRLKWSICYFCNYITQSVISRMLQCIVFKNLIMEIFIKLIYQIFNFISIKRRFNIHY
jgi:hypothetical protein